MNYLVIQLTTTDAVFARFHKRRGSLFFAGGGRQSLDTEHALPDLLAQAKGTGGQQEQVILCVPPESLFLREIELPITDRRKIREVLPLELKGETAIDADELVFDGLPLADGKVLAVWARRSELADRIKILADAGLEPEVVTASLFQWQELAGKVAGTCAVTDGEGLAVMRDGTPIFFRPLKTGDTLEVSRTIAAVEVGKGIAVETLLLHGDAARNRSGFAHDLTKEIPSAPIPIAGELASAFPEDGDAVIDMAGPYAVARACMIGNEINFRTGELAYTAGRDRLRRKLRLTAILAAACVLLIFAEAGVRYYSVNRDLTSLNRSIGSIYREIFPNRKKPVDEVAELRSEIKRLSGGATSSPVLVALRQLSEAKGDDVAGLYEVEVDGSQVRVKGDARSIQAVNDFRTRTAAAFAGGEVGEIKSRPDGTVSFVFRGTLKGEAK